MTEQPEKSNVEVLAVETVSATVYARIPVVLLEQLDEYAMLHGATRSAAIRELLEKALVDELPITAPRPERDPWVDRARLREALHCLRAVTPSGYRQIDAIINGVLNRTGDD